MNFLTHIFEGFLLDFKLSFNVFFLRIISWKGTSRFNGGGCFSDGVGFIFKWERGAPLRGIGFDGGGWGRFRRTLLDGGRQSKINKPENQKMKVLFLGSNEKKHAGKEQGQD